MLYEVITILTNIPSGHYQLEIQYTNGDRIWSDKTYTLFLDVDPPWWRSNVAYFIYFVIMAVLIFLVFQIIRSRISKNQQKMLEEIEKLNQQKMLESKFVFFTNIAHEFLTPLTLIYGPAQQLLEKRNNFV